MIETSTDIKNITAALLRFQGHVSGVKRDAQNPHFRSRYATLENVIDTARPVLQEVGVMFTQAPGAIVDGALEVTTLLVHSESGEWMRSTMQMPLAKRDPQGAGSAQTYSMRYSLMAMLGLPPTDDDGEAAMERPTGTPNTVTGPALVSANQSAKSSAALKRDGAWEKLHEELTNDFVDCHSLASLHKLRIIYRQKAVDNGWPKAWLEALKDQFDAQEDALKKVEVLQAGE